MSDDNIILKLGTIEEKGRRGKCSSSFPVKSSKLFLLNVGPGLRLIFNLKGTQSSLLISTLKQEKITTLFPCPIPHIKHP